MSILKYFEKEEAIFLPQSDSGTENASDKTVAEALSNNAGGSESPVEGWCALCHFGVAVFFF